MSWAFSGWHRDEGSFGVVGAVVGDPGEEVCADRHYVVGLGGEAGEDGAADLEGWASDGAVVEGDDDAGAAGLELRRNDCECSRFETVGVDDVGAAHKGGEAPPGSLVGCDNDLVTCLFQAVGEEVHMGSDSPV